MEAASKRTTEPAESSTHAPSGDELAGAASLAIAAANRLFVAWKELPVEQLNAAEAGYHAAFAEEFGRLPFANLVQSRVKGS